ncbi:DUF6082 family protein [Streptomyces sp. NPDC048191]|uniref:DUF6082 family protein n=1 Tax=Streptomyces sp. NPDC048191 TaxID=3155484 RepID=UPI0033C993E0
MPNNRQRVAQQGLYWAVAAVLSLGAMLATPFALAALAPRHMNWERLSAISQTYGALSVFISPAALVGVALSLAYQARQTGIENEEAHLSAHRELILLTLSEPAYQTCWGPPNTPMTREQWKQILVSNLIVSMWSSAYKRGFADEREIRAILDDYFRGEDGRRYWHSSGPAWHRYFADSRNRRQRRFLTLAEDAYRTAVAAGPPVPTREYFITSAQ